MSRGRTEKALEHDVDAHQSKGRLAGEAVILEDGRRPIGMEDALWHEHEASWRPLGVV